MSYSKSSLSHYHTSARKRPISLLSLTKAFMVPFSLSHCVLCCVLCLCFPLRMYTCAIVRLLRKTKLQPTQNIYICFAIFSVIVYACFLRWISISISGSHTFSAYFTNYIFVCLSFFLHLNRPIPNAFQLFATYVLLAGPLCFHCVCLCYLNLFY